MADHYVPVPGGTNNNNYANVELILDIAKRIPVQVGQHASLVCDMAADQLIITCDMLWFLPGGVGWLGPRLRKPQTPRAASQEWHRLHGYEKSACSLPPCVQPLDDLNQRCPTQIHYGPYFKPSALIVTDCLPRTSESGHVGSG